LTAIGQVMMMMTCIDRENRRVERAEPESIIYPIVGMQFRACLKSWAGAHRATCRRMLIPTSINRAVIDHRHWSRQQPIAVPDEELTSHRDCRHC